MLNNVSQSKIDAQIIVFSVHCYMGDFVTRNYFTRKNGNIYASHLLRHISRMGTEFETERILHFFRLWLKHGYCWKLSAQDLWLFCRNKRRKWCKIYANFAHKIKRLRKYSNIKL